MPAQTRQKVGNRHKAHRSFHKKAYYERYRRLYELKKIRRKADRLKRIATKRTAESSLHNG